MTNSPGRVVVLVPRRSDNGWRDRLWGHVQSTLAGWEIYEGHHDVGPFNRSAAINTAAREAGEWDVAVILDADTLVPPLQIMVAVNAAHSTGRVSFAFERYRALDEEGTRRVLDGFEGDREPFVVDMMVNSGSSCLAITRNLWDEVGGFDEGFTGWGWEDVAFSWACQTLGGGMNRAPGDCWHLWHPKDPDAGNTASPTYQANRDRCRPYEEAAGDQARMRDVIARHRQ